MLKKIRVSVSIIFFSVLSYYFLDFADLLPKQLHLVTKLQFLPALIAVNTITIVIVTGLTLLLGRIYCSSICPLGVLQDIISWLSKKVQHKKKYRPLKEKPILRWTMVALTALAFIAGVSAIVSLLDPYSAYGRLAGTLFKPVYFAGNNIIAWIDNYYKQYRFYKLDIFFTSLTALITASLTLLIIGFLSYKWGRLYCNTICPVGTVLGFLARFSIIKVTINTTKCNSCSLCSMKCKSSCIDAKKKKIDYSRCVDCFNCLQACNRKAMKYRLAIPVRKVTLITDNTQEHLPSRRKFLALFFTGFAAAQKIFGKNPADSSKPLKKIYTSHNIAYKRKHPITPPGSVNINRFNKRCTACQLCVNKCPSNVLQPSFLDYGLAGLLQPSMNFQHGYCNYHCTLCSSICPSNALEPISAKEKKTLQVGYVDYIKENCVVVTEGTDCGACSEHCPTQAVSMQPYKGDLRIPVIDQSLCVGCGGCEYICPTRPYRAIYVVGNEVHKQALIPEEKNLNKIEVNDFGF